MQDANTAVLSVSGDAVVHRASLRSTAATETRGMALSPRKVQTYGDAGGRSDLHGVCIYDARTSSAIPVHWLRPPRLVTGPSWCGLEIVGLKGEIKGVSSVGGLFDLWHVRGHHLVTRRVGVV